MKSEIDHERMNKPGQNFIRFCFSALRAVRLCQPLKVPPTIMKMEKYTIKL